MAEKRKEALPPTVLVLTTEGQILTRSSAALYIMERLGGWRVMALWGAWCRQGSGIFLYRFIARVPAGFPTPAVPRVPCLTNEFVTDVEAHKLGGGALINVSRLLPLA